MNRKLQRFSISRPMAVLAAVSLCITLSGCYGVYEGKAEKNIKQATDWQAEKFDESKPIFESAKKSLDAAKQANAGKQGGEARKQAKEAATLSEQAMNAAKTRYADQQLKQAKKAMEVARINDGQSQNAKLYTTAEANFNEANEKYGKQKYEDTINLSRQVQTDVDQLLATLKNTAHNQLETLRQRMRDLDAAQASKYNPQPILRGNEQVERIKEKIENDRDYKQAIIMAGGTISEIEAGIIEAKKKHSEAELRGLEDKIAEAITEEAPIHVPDALKNVQDQFEAILAGFYEKQFDSVLSAAEALKPRVDQLITMSRIEATKDRIRQVTEGVQRLKEQNVEQYLPGRVKVMEDLLAKSQDQFNNNNYEGAKFEAGNALIEQDRITASFDALAESTIQDASGSVIAARQTYTRMGQIFGTGQTAVDPRLESRFQIRSAELNAKLAEASQQLDFSNTTRRTKEFRKAIESAKVSHATADSVANGTYKLVTENALLGIQDQISALERQGAREFAPRQLGEVQSLVEQTQKLVSENQNREAADRVAKTRATLENVKQELARRAVEEGARTGDILRRIEGGAAPTPASGGGPQTMAPRTTPYGQYPGGTELNNKESMFATDITGLSSSDARELSARQPIVLAQTHVGHPTNSSGWTGEQGYLDNRNITHGTYMTHNPPDRVFLGTGSHTGAIIGTRPEPVVPTREDTGSYTGGSQGSYEPPTAPGPFVALGTSRTGGAAVALSATAGGDTASAPLDSGVAIVRAQINDIVLDQQRSRDLRTYQPDAIRDAEAKLSESASALASGEYIRATQLAQEAQKIIVDADRKAAEAAATKSIQDAADRINIAEAAGAVMFAPAQLNEAIKLYEQARSSLKTGDVHDARAVAGRAMVAAEDARLYNVTKAHDLAALSIRYGGYKSTHPALSEANNLAYGAENLLNHPNSAAAGQEMAKQAVMMGQLALDSARDYSFQERLDNIYKALNTALRAGANYFNVAEVKRLIAELAVAREEYCTHNYDAVELKLKDIEARLARVIETTPLVLEENLIETTEKLNALVLAGAENWMAQEVDDVKSLMNRSVIDFRKHDYYSSYTNIRNAMALTERIEARLQEQVYYDAITELFAQMDLAFRDFSQVLDYDRVFLKKLITTPQGQPAAIGFRGQQSPNLFKDRITDIYLRAIHLKAPKSQEGTHNEVITSIKFAKVAAENFQKLFILDQVSYPDAYDIIDTAFNQFQRSRILRGEIQVRLIDPQARTKVIRAEKIVNF
ncbi:MAG: hypothetical protein ACR2IE_19935 [Candidatus Sumerlaeaceae bacterium]